MCQDAVQSRAEIETRIEPDGWQLLNVLSVFGADELENRKESAGEFFLRF